VSPCGRVATAVYTAEIGKVSIAEVDSMLFPLTGAFSPKAYGKSNLHTRDNRERTVLIPENKKRKPKNYYR
jgi:hypothetical protein